MPDYIRIACAVPAVRVGDVMKNAADICGFIEEAAVQNVDLIIFPELALTGCTCGDLFRQDLLLRAVEDGVKRILDCSKEHPGITAVVGLPVRCGARLLSCAAVIREGEILGLKDKTCLEHNQRRWFSPAADGDAATFCGNQIPVSSDKLYMVGERTLAVSLCGELLETETAQQADVLVNLAATVELAGKRRERNRLVRLRSSDQKCICAYASAGCTESTSDFVYAGHSIIAEKGALLAESAFETMTDHMIVCDCGRVTSCAEVEAPQTADPLSRLPFVPATEAERIGYCMDVFRLQVAGLKQRLSLLGASAVIGISGGLDSTLALLVAVEAMRQLGRPMTDVHGITMPCFGTSDRTYRNAWKLMQTLGITAKEIPIADAVRLHFRNIGHDESTYNATYENAQARERTQVLMDYAGKVGGIVVGTGDLSELALGWCTYNGDHMSMYSVNASVPKTLIRWVIDAVSKEPAFAGARDVLLDVIDTPISPELLPPDAKGNISQQTEDIVGPYALHDFFLFYTLGCGYSPKKIYSMACRAFDGHFDGATVKKWLENFYRRFFTQQFKRNCVPDGIRVGPVGLSPRGDWQMPSDAAARLWLDEVESL